MQKITIPNMVASDYAYLAGSGRAYLIKIASAGAVGEGWDFQYTGGTVDQTSGAFVGSPMILNKQLHSDGIAARSHGFGPFWKRFVNELTPYVTITMPAGLSSPGPTVVNGQTWWAGTFDPAHQTSDPNILLPSTGEIGDWYADLGNGSVWKKRIGDLEWLALGMAMELEKKAAAQDTLAALNLPVVS